MKTLIVYDKNGNILFAQTPVEDDCYCNYLIADIPEDRQIIKVENGKPIFQDPVEILEKRERLEVLLNEVSGLKQDLLEYEVNNLNENR